jgi:hypothetical protein
MKKFLVFLFLIVGLFAKSQVQVVQLDGSASSDPDGSIVGYQWTALANPSATTFATPTQAKTTVIPAGGLQWKAGVYSFVLTVTDNLGAISKDTVTVTFKLNLAPKANAGPDQLITVNQVASIGAADIGNDLAVHWRRLMGIGSYYIQSPTATITKVYGLRRGLHLFEKTVSNSAGVSVDYVQVIVKQNLF